MPDFHEIQFPTDISYGSTGGPEFSTEIVILSSAHEKRNINWTYPRERWQVAYGVKEKSQLDALRAFFYICKGRAIGFRFKNHDDYQATTAQALGTGDDSTVDFQLVKIYTSGGQTLTRKITKPVSGSVSVFIENVEQESGWTIDTTTGIITFDTAPSTNEVITATFQFDVPMRFDTDYFPVNLANLQARAADFQVVEIRI